jgi:hypothetical protein
MLLTSWYWLTPPWSRTTSRALRSWINKSWWLCATLGTPFLSATRHTICQSSLSRLLRTRNHGLALNLDLTSPSILKWSSKIQKSISSMISSCSISFLSTRTLKNSRRRFKKLTQRKTGPISNWLKHRRNSKISQLKIKSPLSRKSY